MKNKALLLLGFAALLLSATVGFSQSGGPGAPQSAPDARGRGGRFPGGRGGDPNELFNQMTNGKDVWIRSEVQDPRMQRRFDFIAGQLGVTNGQITRQQYLSFQSDPAAATRGGRRGPGGPSDGSQGDGGFRDGRRNPDSTPDGMFNRLDVNGDGVLNSDEMPEELRSERQKWDTDRNGLIDLAEFKAFYQARVQPMLANRGGANPQGLDYSWEAAPVEEERKPPVVYRPGKLPKELPTWFTQLDTNQDGQVALFEWKASGKTLQEFDEMDRNKDGFLTVDEVLRFTNKGKENTPEGQPNYAWNGGDFGRFGRGGFPPFFGGRDRGGRDYPRGGGRGGMRRGGFGGGAGYPGGGGGPSGDFPER